jgi:flagellar biosynthesis anti-sigma factor FlgM
MKVQNKTGNINGVDPQKTDRLDLKSKQGKKDLGSLDKSAEFNDAARVDLSQRAQDMKKIKDLAMAEPSGRAEKIARLQKLIDEGNYKVDTEAVADRMVDEHLIFNE